MNTTSTPPTPPLSLVDQAKRPARPRHSHRNAADTRPGWGDVLYPEDTGWPKACARTPGPIASPARLPAGAAPRRAGWPPAAPVRPARDAL